MKPLSAGELRELDLLLNALCNRCIDEAGRARLTEILAASDDACRRYVEILHLCIGISYLSGVGAEHGMRAAQRFASSRFSSINAFPALELPAPDFDGFHAGACQSSSASTSPNLLCWLFDRRGLAFFAALIFLTATIAILPHRNRKAISPVTSPQSVVDVFDARTVRIDSGSAKVSLPKVGYMLIDGPAEVDLISPLRANLHRGRIRVRVTEATGHGFVVETPDGDVADLSTEFGLDVSEGKKTGVVVFDGEVDLLTLGGSKRIPRIQRLVGGEGVTFDKSGKLSRITSIVTGDGVTFQSLADLSGKPSDRVIAQVSDSVRAAELKNFYEIVPGGLKEDALAYADRPAHDWNGIDERGMPQYLLGADYVKTFNDDKMRRDVNIFVTLAQPAQLFVLLDKRVSPPDWLRKAFRNTGDEIGLDAGAYTMAGVPITFVRATGPGKSLDAWFSIWTREVPQAGVVSLGPNLGASGYTGMYAIAATRLNRPAVLRAAEEVRSR